MFYHDVEFKNNRNKIIRNIEDNGVMKNNTRDILKSFRSFNKT